MDGSNFDSFSTSAGICIHAAMRMRNARLRQACETIPATVSLFHEDSGGGFDRLHCSWFEWNGDSLSGLRVRAGTGPGVRHIGRKCVSVRNLADHDRRVPGSRGHIGKHVMPPAVMKATGANGRRRDGPAGNGKRLSAAWHNLVSCGFDDERRDREFSSDARFPDPHTSVSRLSRRQRRLECRSRAAQRAGRPMRCVPRTRWFGPFQLTISKRTSKS